MEGKRAREREKEPRESGVEEHKRNGTASVRHIR